MGILSDHAIAHIGHSSDPNPSSAPLPSFARDARSQRSFTPLDDERLLWAGRAVKSPIEAQSIQGGTRRSAFQGEHGKPRRDPATSATTSDSSELECEGYRAATT